MRETIRGAETTSRSLDDTNNIDREETRETEATITIDPLVVLFLVCHATLAVRIAIRATPRQLLSSPVAPYVYSLLVNPVVYRLHPYDAGEEEKE